MKRILLLAVLLVLSACAGQQLAPGKLSPIKTLGIVSATETMSA